MRHLVLAGTYADSVVLLQLQRALTALPAVEEAAVVMATTANLELLGRQGLLGGDADGVRPDDLLVAVRAADAAAAEAALAEVPALLRARRSGEGVGEHRPRSLAGALRELPDAAWVLVSVPGRWAAGVAREALAAGRHVFLYSDNVSLADEVALKQEARERGLLVLGPDCGTAIVGGVGFGFANRVRRGAVGLVAASGTGLQAVACGIHELGGGISHALGTGGRDLGAEVGGATALAALDLLRRDQETRVVVLLSKPPAAPVTARLLAAARRCGKPVVVWLLGAPVPVRRVGDVYFATSSEEASRLAAALAAGTAERHEAWDESLLAAAGKGVTDGRLLGLFAGGTLAQEAFLALQPWLAPLGSNLGLPGSLPLGAGAAHEIVDLGADELTVGRPHPMLEPSLRCERIAAAAGDPRCSLLLLDLVLGEGSHPDPAADLAPAIATARATAAGAGRDLAVVVLLVGSSEDPQGLREQTAQLRWAGAWVTSSLGEAVQYALARVLAHVASPWPEPPVPLAALADGPAVVDLGLATFHDSLRAQGASALHVDWRPPAGGDERLARLLERMR